MRKRQEASIIHHELEEIYTGNALIENDVQTAIDNTISAKNKARFEPYFSRLKGLLEQNEYAYAIEILSYTANNGSIDNSVLFDRAIKHNLNDQIIIIEMLCEDGYLYETEGVFVYTSPILQLWCKKFNK